MSRVEALGFLAGDDRDDAVQAGPITFVGARQSETSTKTGTRIADPTKTTKRGRSWAPVNSCSTEMMTSAATSAAKDLAKRRPGRPRHPAALRHSSLPR